MFVKKSGKYPIPSARSCNTGLIFGQSLARVVFSGVCLVISLGSEVLYLINSWVGILSSFDAIAS